MAKGTWFLLAQSSERDGHERLGVVRYKLTNS